MQHRSYNTGTVCMIDKFSNLRMVDPNNTQAQTIYVAQETSSKEKSTPMRQISHRPMNFFVLVHCAPFGVSHDCYPVTKTLSGCKPSAQVLPAILESTTRGGMERADWSFVAKTRRAGSRWGTRARKHDNGLQSYVPLPSPSEGSCSQTAQVFHSAFGNTGKDRSQWECCGDQN